MEYSMEYKVIYNTGEKKCTAITPGFIEALSMAEHLHASGINYICIKDEDDLTILELF